MTNHNSTSWQTSICAVVTHFHITSIISNAIICQSAFLHNTLIIKRMTVLIKDNLKSTWSENVFEYINFQITLKPAQCTYGCANPAVLTVHHTLQAALTHTSFIFSETLEMFNISSYKEPHKLLISTQTCHLLSIK